VLSTKLEVIYHYDEQGNVIQETDEEGNIVKRYRFDLWGNLQAQWGTEPNHYLFIRKEKDRSGLYYFGARYYNPRLGRWITPDPEPRVPGERLLENPQLLNPYGVHPDLIKMGKIAIQVILYKELLHATFHYKTKGTEWEERFSEPEWHAAEEVVGVKKVFKYIEKLKKRKIEVPKEIVEGLKSTMEYYEHLTTKEHIEAIEKEMEKYGL